MPRWDGRPATSGSIPRTIMMRMSNGSRGISTRHSPLFSSHFLRPRIPPFRADIQGRVRSKSSPWLPTKRSHGGERRRWKHRGEDYEALKNQLSDRLRAELERHVPSAIGNIAYTELSTPVSTRHFMNYSHGEIYGIISTPERFAVRGLGARTPIRGLYLTGQDVSSLGVVGASYGGIIAPRPRSGRT